MTAATSAAAQSALLTSAQAGRRAPKRVLPGFGLTLGYTLFYLSIIVLIPLSALIFKTFTLTWDQFWAAISSPRVVASYQLTFGASFFAALVNLVFGLLIAWVLVRYKFPGKKIVDALVDLPFALPTAVAGISLTALLAGNGWIGQILEPMGIQLAFKPAGIVIALIFIGLPPASVPRVFRPSPRSSCPPSRPRCSPALPWHLRGRWANTARSSSLQATSPWCLKSRPSSSSASWSSTTTPAPLRWQR